MSLRMVNYGTFEVRETLVREGGAVDLVVAYTRAGARPVYASYRHCPDAGWLALNESWTALETAVAETPGLERSEPLRSPKLRRILTEALPAALKATA